MVTINVRRYKLSVELTPTGKLRFSGRPVAPKLLPHVQALIETVLQAWRTVCAGGENAGRMLPPELAMAARAAAAGKRARASLGYGQATVAAGPSLAERLAVRSFAAAKRAVYSALPRADKVCVGAPRVARSESLDWTKYRDSRGRYGYPEKTVYTTVFVREDWSSRLRREGCPALVRWVGHDWVVLDAEEGRAYLARQGRGKSAETLHLSVAVIVAAQRRTTRRAA